MQTRIIIGGLIAMLAVGGSALAFAGDSEPRMAPQPVAVEAAPLPGPLAKAQTALTEATERKIKCRTLRCINKSLNQLTGALTTLSQCMSYIEVARYPGYMYSNDGGATEFPTTALDTTPPGTPGTHVAVFTC